MSTTAPPAFSFAKLFPRRRVLFTLAVVLPLGLLLGISSLSPTLVVVGRGLLVGLFAMLAFGLLEQWPARLPKRLARWVLQLIGVVVAIPFAALLAYWVTTGGDPHFGQNPKRVIGFLSLTFLGGWSRPGSRSARWCGSARRLRATRRWRSSSSAASSSARRSMRGCGCCRRRSQPHFLFNTLANVQALVDAGSPQASRGAAQPHRLPARGRAAPARAGDDARPGAASWCAPISS